MSNVVEISNLDFSYQDQNKFTQVLHNINLEIEEGSTFGLVGESGCGKSTLAYLCLGYQYPLSIIHNGNVKINGKQITDIESKQLNNLRGRVISIVPQNPTTSLSPHMKVGYQVSEILKQHKMIKNFQDSKDKIKKLFDSVGLVDDNIILKYPHQLSGGQQQRVCIAMAIACNPRMLVLDEPTTGLDVTTQRQIISLLESLRKKNKLSMLYVTHDLSVLAQIADKIAVMYAGHIVEIAETKTLFENPIHPYTKGLIGSVPSLDISLSNRRLKGVLLREELPSGCAFYPRCDYRKDSCKNTSQKLNLVKSKQHVACHLWDTIDLSTVEDNYTVESKKIEYEKKVLLDVKSITLSYESKSSLLNIFKTNTNPVIKNMSFQLMKGETVALVGESGSGKSTIAKAISGLIPSNEGTIHYYDKLLENSIIKRSKRVRKNIQYVFQNPDASLNPRTIIKSILSRPLSFFYNLNKIQIKEKLSSTLKSIHLGHNYLNRLPTQLSGGERQRIAIARALISEPDLLLCDEVLSALDVSVQANIIDLLEKIQRDSNSSMLFISHDLAVVKNLADRVIVIYHGQIMEAGPVKEIFSPPYHPYTHSLLKAVPGMKKKEGYLNMEQDIAIDNEDNLSGCPFYNRCSSRIDNLCKNIEPPIRNFDDDLKIKCHLENSVLEKLYTNVV
jgi:peptide/nickel transport system ATP-binding protein